MIRRRARVLALLVAVGLGANSAHANQKAKIFLTTTSYGVMAGSLTGLASMTFYEAPGDHMKNIAVGASLGLYAGILMGAYMIYGMPEFSGGSSSPGDESAQPESIDLGSNAPGPIPYIGMNRDVWQGGLVLKF